MIIPTIPPIEKVIFSTTIDVSIRDINYGRHLGHDALVSLLHEVRVQFLCTHGFTEFDIAGSSILVKTLLVDYMKEAFYGEKLNFCLGIEYSSKTSIQMIYAVKNSVNNVRIASAVTTLVFFDFNNNKISRIPDEFLKIIGN